MGMRSYTRFAARGRGGDAAGARFDENNIQSDLD